MVLNGKVALITGATGGLGRWVTNAFLEAGARVAGSSVHMRAEDFAGPNFMALPGAVDSLDAARAAADRVHARWGRIDALIHLVGGFEGGVPVAETTDAALDRMLDLNLRTAFHFLRAVLPGMRERGSGRIAAIASRTAAAPAPLLGVYSASKAALVSLMQTVALENKDRGITSNVILPGTMDTPANRAANSQADFSRWVPPAEVARLLVHLASDDAAHLSGAVIPVLGGDL